MEKKQRRAFKLSYFILREEQAALRATADAVSALDVTLVRQDKRIHYLPGHRTKVSLGEWQIMRRARSTGFVRSNPQPGRNLAAIWLAFHRERSAHR
jgi:hypothetical protein